VEDSNEGFERPVNRGDYIILSTGAIATARHAYPAGYRGVVEMLLDGAEVADEVSSLTLPEENATVTQSSPREVTIDGGEGGEVRGRSVRMED
jgi:hypothetical protein